VIDNYDSFVYNLVQYLGELGAEPLVYRHDAITVEQALDMLEEGPIQTPVAKFGFVKPPIGDAYARGENPRGDFGVYLVSRGETSPYRCKIRGPSFSNLMALRDLTVGAYIADAVVILGSLDIVLGEVDR